jgi:hypothetical protein
MLQLQAILSSPYILGIYLSVILYNLQRTFFNFNGQLQEEAGSAGGQPASNKADTYTVNKEAVIRGCSFIYLPVSHMA